MDYTLITVALISGAFPTIGLIITTLYGARGRVKDIQTSTKMEIYKDNMIKRQNAYQSLISTAREMGDRYKTCIFIFERKNLAKPFNHDGLDYQDKDEFFTRYFLPFYNQYINIEKNNIMYSSKSTYPLVVNLSAAVKDLRTILSNIANNQYTIKDEHKKNVEDYRSKFIDAYDTFVNKVFDENEQLIQ